MADRRSFLGAVSGAAASVLLTGAAEAQPAASPSPAPKAPSAEARAQAEAMRAFDPHLSDAEVETIARGIDAATGAGSHLNKGGRVLRNGDEPVTAFFVDGVSS
jgi:hypothetical protein